MRREVEAAAYKCKRENDHPWGLHNNLLHLNCHEEEILERGEGLTGVPLVGIALPRECYK